MLVTYEKSLNGKEPRDGIFPFHSYSMLNDINRSARATSACLKRSLCPGTEGRVV